MLIRPLTQTHYVQDLLAVAELAASTYYDQVKAIARDETREDPYAEVKAEIHAIQDGAKDRYGHRKVHAVLHAMGIMIARKTVNRLMHETGRVCKARPKQRQHRPRARDVTNVLDRAFERAHPNEVWVADITEFSVNGERVYVCPVMDLYDRSILGCAISPHPTAGFATSALAEAYASAGNPDGVIVHTDRGLQFTSTTWRDTVKTHNGTLSMSGKRACWDNAVAENLFSHMKRELFTHTKPTSTTQLTELITDWVTWYNHNRIQTRTHQTPTQTRTQYTKTQLRK